MGKATRLNVNIEKMDNGWMLYANGEYPVEGSMAEDSTHEKNVREIHASLDKLLERVVELS